MDFIRGQGVIGLAVGIILGGSVGKLVASLVSDIINPLLGIILGAAGNLSSMTLDVMGAKIMYGNFLATLIDFLVVSFVIYYGVNALKLNKSDKKNNI